MPKIYSPIRKAKASDLIVEEIWAAILNGELKPGEKLPPERELVEQFAVSKVTLREALQSLEAN
jgi:GntR family transcriptional repressor for pyruvate dehydrogenase complex